MRSEHQFVGMMRIRNEARWIGRVIEAALQVCERVFVMDDHSTDESVSICRGFDKARVFNSPFSGLEEARDKNWLFDQVMAHCKPEWILCIDGDEELAPGSADILRQHVVDHPCHAYSFKIVYLWNDERTARVDRIYGDFWRPSMFKPFHPDPNKPDEVKLASTEFRWMSTPFGRVVNGNKPNLHCSSVPQRFLHGCERMPVSLLHYGYMHRADRVRKLDYYNSIDWLNQAEDSYRHMTQGDNVSLDELPKTRKLIARGHISESDAQYMIHTPPSARLVHAGPIELASL